MQDMDKIYREHAKTVCKFLYVRTQDMDWAEELTQETFYRAINSLDTYNGSCKIATWLCQIAKHIWQQELEKKSKLQTEELPEELVDPKCDIEKQFIDSEQKLQLLIALHHLKNPMKEVVYLRIFADLSFSEIGLIFTKSETWARVTYFRGKKELSKGEHYEP